MTYEINELLEIGDAGATIEGPKNRIMDEVSGILGPNQAELEDE